MTDKKLERPLFLEMPFGEALARYGLTKPEEVTPAPGQKRKGVKPHGPDSKAKNAV
jgi:hypothetical protein